MLAATPAPDTLDCRPYSKLSTFPSEIIERIICHVVFDREKFEFWPIHFHPSPSSIKFILNLRFVCSKWASVGQRVLWKYVHVASGQAERVLASPAFGRHPITSLKLENIGDGHQICSILGRVKSLRELVWDVKPETLEETWWNNQSLANLAKLTLLKPLAIPKHPEQCFQLKELVLDFLMGNLKNEEKTLTRLIDCCASTLEVVEFVGISRVPAWFDRCRLPCLRILKSTIFFSKRDKKLHTKNLDGFTHIHINTQYFLDPTILDLSVFPPTLESLEITSDFPFAVDDSECIWPSTFRNPLGKEGLNLPSLRLIRLRIPRWEHDPTHRPRYSEVEDRIRPITCMVKMSLQELYQIEMTRVFWEEHNVLFNVQWIE